MEIWGGIMELEMWELYLVRRVIKWEGKEKKERDEMKYGRDAQKRQRGSVRFKRRP